MDPTRLLPLRFLSHPRSGRWPWIVWAAAWALVAGGAAMYLLTYTVPLGPRWAPRWALGVGAMMFAPLGAVVAARQPRNPIGWIYCATGGLCGLQFFTQEYAVFSLLYQPGRLPAGEWAAWLQSWIWVLVVAFYLIFVPMRLPQGRLPSPRWRPVAVFAAGATLLLALSIAAQPGRLTNFYPVINPLGVGSEAGVWLRLQQAAYVAMGLAIGAAAFSLTWRVRHTDGLERQQLRWLAFAFSMGAPAILVGLLVPSLAAPLLLGAIMVMQVTTGISILRYRLYDLDVVINRTVVYALLTAALAGLYFGFVVVLQGLAVALTGQQRSELVTVLSTLAIAALFNPLRHRIQGLIDRRFFRRKYDATQALARFSQALRDQTNGDLETINADLMRVVDETLEPASLSLWVRPESHPPQL